MKIIQSIFIYFFLIINFAESRDYIIVQSTTSTANTGLLDLLSEEFYKETGIEVRAVAVGTGTAIANARKGDADLLMVHAKKDELRFVEEGYGVERYDLMYNDFVIVGPKNDPANIKKEKDIIKVMEKLASPNIKFISRDDNSGTYKKELALWQKIGILIPHDSSYIKTGTGMANTINVASEMDGYVLTDRGTWISFINKKNLQILFQGDSSLLNPYGIIALNPEKFPHVEYTKSQKFINWLLHEGGNDLIKNYNIRGKQLFFTYK